MLSTHLPGELITFGPSLVLVGVAIYFWRTGKGQEWLSSHAIFTHVDHDWISKAEPNLYDKLASGDLISKGFWQPKNIEMDIPSTFWKVMRFKGPPYVEAEGDGVRYIGIRVAKR
jgi:hypothetical protein